MTNTIFKTISLNGKVTKKQLEEAGFKVGDYASDLLGKTTFSKKGKLDLVKVSVKDLGLPDGGTLKEIYDKAQEQGLELCPAEVGPQLRMQYPDQPITEWLLIAMEPITDSDGDLHVFNVGHYHDDRWLSTSYGYPGDIWFSAFDFVFPRKSTKPSKTKHSLDPKSLEARVEALEETVGKLTKIINL